MTEGKAQHFVTDKLLTLRLAISRIQVEGTETTAIKLHPDDSEEIETTKPADNDYLLDGGGAHELRLAGTVGRPRAAVTFVGAARSAGGAFDPTQIGLVNRGGLKL